jgi:hypothetical protein
MNPDGLGDERWPAGMSTETPHREHILLNFAIAVRPLQVGHSTILWPGRFFSERETPAETGLEETTQGGTVSRAPSPLAEGDVPAGERREGEMQNAARWAAIPACSLASSACLAEKSAPTFGAEMDLFPPINLMIFRIEAEILEGVPNGLCADGEMGILVWARRVLLKAFIMSWPVPPAAVMVEAGIHSIRRGPNWQW